MPKQHSSASRRSLVKRFIGRSTIYLFFCGVTVTLLKVLQDREGFSLVLKVYFNVFWIYLSLVLGATALVSISRRRCCLLSKASGVTDMCVALYRQHLVILLVWLGGRS